MFNNAHIQHSLEFIPREQVHSPWLIGFFVCCILLVVVARLFQRDVFVLLLEGSFLFRSIEVLGRDGKRLSNVSSLLLLFQFFFISFYLYYVKVNGKHSTLPSANEWLIIAVLPAYWLYLVCIQWMAGLLGKQSNLIREIIFYTQVISNTIGLVLLLILFIDFFEPFLGISANWVLMCLIGLVFLLRFFRGFILAIQQGIPWYYIILYFWTLEILPVLIGFKLLQPELFREWFS